MEIRSAHGNQKCSWKSEVLIKKVLIEIESAHGNQKTFVQTKNAKRNTRVFKGKNKVVTRKDS